MSSSLNSILMEAVVKTAPVQQKDGITFTVNSYYKNAIDIFDVHIYAKMLAGFCKEKLSVGKECRIVGRLKSYQLPVGMGCYIVAEHVEFKGGKQ